MTEATVQRRMISPSRRRLYTPKLVGEPTQENLTASVERGKRCAEQLYRLGWRVYVGPAQADALGFVIDGTDPNLVPLPLSTVYPRMHGAG